MRRQQLSGMENSTFHRIKYFHYCTNKNIHYLCNILSDSGCITLLKFFNSKFEIFCRVEIIFLRTNRKQSENVFILGFYVRLLSIGGNQWAADGAQFQKC
jgi:hypothetical protein